VPLPDPMPRALAAPAAPEITHSPALSLTARPGYGSVRARKVAVLVADGVNAKPIVALRQALTAQGGVTRLVGPQIGTVHCADGPTLQADASLENEPGFLFDAVVLPDGEKGSSALALDARALEFVRDAYRHCKPLMAVGTGAMLLERVGVPLEETDPALVIAPQTSEEAIEQFVAAVGAPRHFERETDPPRV